MDGRHIAKEAYPETKKAPESFDSEALSECPGRDSNPANHVAFRATTSNVARKIRPLEAVELVELIEPADPISDAQPA